MGCLCSDPSCTCDHITLPQGSDGADGLNGTSILYNRISTAGIAAVTTAEAIVMSYTLPGGQLATDGSAIRITATFEEPPNTSNSRTYRVKFGATTVGIAPLNHKGSNTVTNKVVIDCIVSRNSATTQYSITRVDCGTLTRSIFGFVLAPFETTPAETLANDILVTTTIQGSTVATCNNLMIEYLRL